MSRLSRCLVATAMLLGAAASSRADEFKPGYLQLTQIDHDVYDVLWKIPAINEFTTLKVKLQFPDGTVTVSEVRSTYSQGVMVQRWRIRVPEGLDGKAIVFSQLSETRIDVLARLVRLDGTVQLERILPVGARFVVRSSPGQLEVVRTYTVLGIEHILTGFDHLLYVLAMLMLVTGWRRIVATMSAFTATHSLTLTAATLGWVHVPQPPVEACIALSILFVAREIVQAHRGRAGLTARWPWAVSFTFGLMHGFGFAGALAQVGLPVGAIPTALLFFNVGVELGQLMFVASVLALIAAGRSLAQGFQCRQPDWLWRVGPYAIGGLACFWLVERVSGF
jgi:hydrogenase/urease accessory protein HupE